MYTPIHYISPCVYMYTIHTAQDSYPVINCLRRPYLVADIAWAGILSACHHITMAAGVVGGVIKGFPREPADDGVHVEVGVGTQGMDDSWNSA